MKLNNKDIRDYAKANNVPLYLVANHMNICEMTLSRKLRFELDENEKQKIMSIIDELAEH